MSWKPIVNSRRPSTRHAPLRVSAVCCLVLALLGTATTGDERIPADPELRWWKGNLHTHTLWSDGNDFPEMVAEWYRTHGYHFLALSDHNVLSEGQRWMPVQQVVSRGGREAMDKYVARYGEHWVETRGVPDTPTHEVRLKPLDEFAPLVQERGRFLMIPGEEISDRAEGKPVHLNATNLADVIPPVGGATVRESMQNNLRAVREQAEREGRAILLHLNHPNFGLAVTAEDLAHVRDERFFEVYNGHPGVNHLGDADHPPVERLWDIANTLRLTSVGGDLLYGVATDDSHRYHPPTNNGPGRGWVMVRSRFLTPEHLIAAMRAGDFYSSSGVTLRRLTVQDNELHVAMEPREGVTYTTEFIGTLIGFDDTAEPRRDAEGRPIATTQRYSPEVGQVLARVEGDEASYTMTGAELYVRAQITSSAPHPDPSFEGQFEQAWTQPVRPVDTP